MQTDDEGLSLYLTMLDAASTEVMAALAALDVLALERAELDFAALALRTCDRARDLGLDEPMGLRLKAMAILRRYDGTG